MKPDQKFFDTFSIVIGVLVAITFGIYILSSSMSDQTQGMYTKDTDEYRAQLAERIKPVGQVYMTGDELPAAAVAAVAEVVAAVVAETPAETVTETAPAAQESVADTKAGASVYNGACIACHGMGIAGAPKVGSADAWAARIAKGLDVLDKHAIDGFQGSSGYMPPKGGRVDLSDQDIKNAVAYMVSQSK